MPPGVPATCRTSLAPGPSAGAGRPDGVGGRGSYCPHTDGRNRSLSPTTLAWRRLDGLALSLWATTGRRASAGRLDAASLRRVLGFELARLRGASFATLRHGDALALRAPTAPRTAREEQATSQHHRQTKHRQPLAHVLVILSANASSRSASDSRGCACVPGRWAPATCGSLAPGPATGPRRRWLRRQRGRLLTEC